MDASDAQASLRVIEDSTRQVRAELENGARPAWFFPASGLAVGTCVGSAGLPGLTGKVLTISSFVAISVLAIIEIRFIRMMPYRSSFTAASIAVAIAAVVSVVVAAVTVHGLLAGYHAPAPDAISGACVALVVWAMGRPTLRWMAATMRTFPR